MGRRNKRPTHESAVIVLFTSRAATRICISISKSFRFVKPLLYPISISITTTCSRDVLRRRGGAARPCLPRALVSRTKIRRAASTRPPPRRCILAAVHRPAYAFLSRPFFLFSSSSSSFLLCPGAFIVHRTACMHARDPHSFYVPIIRSALFINRRSPLIQTTVGCLLA